MFLIRFCKFHRKTPVLKSLFNKNSGLRLATQLKSDSSTGFSFEILQVFKSNYFGDHLQTADSFYGRRSLIRIVRMFLWTVWKVLCSIAKEYVKFLDLTFLIKVTTFQVSSFIKKESLAQVLYCRFCEIFKNTFF